MKTYLLKTSWIASLVDWITENPAIFDFNSVIWNDVISNVIVPVPVVILVTVVSPLDVSYVNDSY